MYFWDIQLKNNNARTHARTHDDEVEQVFGAQLGERTNCAHLVWFKPLCVRARVVLLDHTWADIYAYETRNVWRERTRDLSLFFLILITMSLSVLAVALTTGTYFVPDPHA